MNISKLVMLSVASSMLATGALAQNAGEKIPGAYICVFKPGSVARGAEQSNAAASVNAAGGSVTHVYTTAIKGFAARMSAEAAVRLAASNPKIQYCEQDQMMSLGPIRIEARPPSGGTTTQPAQNTPWGVLEVLRGSSFSSGPFKTAWVIDTGIAQHPDLVFDTGRSRSFLSTTSYIDENGHGTHVAGTIAAKNDAIGVVGVAPGAKVVAVRVLDRRGSGSNAGVIAGVDYVAQNGSDGDVANMSLGGGTSSALDTAVFNASNNGKNIRFVLAAGNNSGDAKLSSPARVNGLNIYTVSAFAFGGTFANFSNYGNPPIDFAEPGVSIRSTWLGGGYNTISGTSMAAPHLAGLLLLGPIANGGNVTGDPDGNADVIGVK